MSSKKSKKRKKIQKRKQTIQSTKHASKKVEQKVNIQVKKKKEFSKPKVKESFIKIISLIFNFVGVIGQTAINIFNFIKNSILGFINNVRNSIKGTFSKIRNFRILPVRQKKKLQKQIKKIKYSHEKFKPQNRVKVIEKVKSQKFKKKNRKRKISKIMLFFIGMWWIGMIIFILIVYIYLKERNSEIPTPDKVFPEVGLATEIYDRNGTKLYRLYNDYSNSDKVDINEINDEVKAAFMAAEDSQFYNHHGFDPDAISRCLIQSINDQRECGASTITQQLIKITTKQNQLSIDRKVNEVLLAIKVEKQYTKDQILEMYLRVTPYGSNITGIKTAAKFYYGIEDLKKISLAQAVTLAAIVNNPTHLSPTLSSNNDKALEALEKRRTYVFDQLEEKLKVINEQIKKSHGDPGEEDYFSIDMIRKARSEKIVYKPPLFTDMKAGHFVNYALEILQERNYKNNQEPFKLNDLKSGGYRIYTSLDYDIQKVAENYVEQGGNQYQFWNMHNAALVTIKPDSGEIIAMVGSKSFIGKSEGCDANGQNCLYDPQVNILTSRQSPGSTNKVLGYYEAFRESKLFPGSFLPDIPIKIGNYEPKNWDGKFYGPNHTAREMLRESRNIPAIQVVSMIGVDTYLNTARQFGYTTYKEGGDYGPSVILGGADVLPIEHAQAFGVFANGGDLVDVNPILKIEDKDGKVIYEAKPERKRVADPAAVWQVNQTLYRLDSLGSPIAWDDRQLAGKTGTSEENKDVFVIMWSPDFVTLAMGGNNNNSPLDPNNGWPGNVVTPWVKAYMRDVGDSPYFNAKTPFTRPANVYYGGGDCDYYGKCLGLTKDWLIAGREPARGNIYTALINGQWEWVNKNSPIGF